MTKNPAYTESDEAWARATGVISKEHCNICGRRLNNPADPFSEDCGGDCLLCMAEAGDPECQKAVDAIKGKDE